MSVTPPDVSEKGFKNILTVASILLWAVAIYYARTQMMSRHQYGILFLGAIITIYVIDQFGASYIERDWVDMSVLTIAMLVNLVTTAYMAINYEELHVERTGYALQHEYVLAGAFTVTIIYLTWREFGLTFLGITVGGLAYGMLGPYIPGILGHGGFSLTRLMSILVLDIEGFYGFLTRLVAAWIALFLLYAGLIQGYGAFDIILRGSVGLTKYIKSGVAQTAVIGSMIIGSVNGSQSANAGMTGSFTIPLMKESGIKAETAGGIESVASTAGQVLPPVMGAGAFVMASLLGIRYVDVLIAGLIPAVILVIVIAVAVHYIASNEIDDPEIDTESYKEDIDTESNLYVEAVRFIIPFGVLIYTLGIVQWTIMTSALYTVIAMTVIGIGTTILQGVLDDSSTADATKKSVIETLDGFRQGAVVLAPIAIILAAINGVVDILIATGVPGAISLALFDISGGVMIVAILLAMIVSILMGLGMPTTAAYLVVALLIAPTLINQFLVPDIAAHFFVFYTAILAGLTPPIATCCAITCGISKGSFWGTCNQAIRISAPLFVLPVSFIYHPEIVSAVFDANTLVTAGIILVGALGMVHGLNYPFDYERRLNFPARGLYVVLGVLTMTYPSRFVQIGTVVVLVVLFNLQGLMTYANGAVIRAKRFM